MGVGIKDEYAVKPDVECRVCKGKNKLCHWECGPGDPNINTVVYDVLDDYLERDHQRINPK